MAGEQTPPADGKPNPSPEQKPTDGQPQPKAGDPGTGTDDKGGQSTDDKGQQQPKAGEETPLPQKRAPEKYELTVPEGNRVTADEVSAVEEIARANDWTQEEAQAELAAFDTQRKAQSDKFLSETKADPQLGGENLAVTEKRANAALDLIWPKGTEHGDFVRAYLARHGFINHRHILRGLADYGRTLVEDPGPGGGNGAGKATSQTGRDLTTTDIAARLYPDKK